MEFCIGSVSDILAVFLSLEERESSAIICQLLQALCYLHSCGRMHRDIKGSNVLLNRKGYVKLADFGSCSKIGRANTFVGTPYWMAPEVIMAMDEGEYNTKADVWSVGITCIELAQRKVPLMNMPAMSALYHIPTADSPTFADPNKWTDEFKDFTSKCLIKDPEERWGAEKLLTHKFIEPVLKTNVIIVYDLIERSMVEVDKKDTEMMQGMIDEFLPSESITSQSSFKSTTEDDEDAKTIAGAMKELELEGLSDPVVLQQTLIARKSTSIYRTIRPRANEQPATDSTLSIQNIPNTPNASRFETVKLKTVLMEQKDEGGNQKRDFAEVRNLIKNHQKAKALRLKQDSSELNDLYAQHHANLQKFLNTFLADQARLDHNHQVELDQATREELYDRRQVERKYEDLEKHEMKEFEEHQKRLWKVIKDTESFKDKQTKKNRLHSHEQQKKQSEDHLLFRLQQSKKEEMNKVTENWDKLKITVKKRHNLEQWGIREVFLNRKISIKLTALSEVHQLKIKQKEALQNLITQQSLDQSVKEGEILQRDQRREKKELAKKQIEDMRRRPKLRKRYKLELEQKHAKVVGQVLTTLRTCAHEEMVLMNKEQKAQRTKLLKEEEMVVLAELADEFRKALHNSVQKLNLGKDTLKKQELDQLDKRHREEMTSFQKLVAKKQNTINAQKTNEIKKLQEENKIELSKLQTKYERARASFLKKKKEGLDKLTPPSVGDYSIK